MRALLYGVLVAAWAPLVGCLCPPRAEDWLAVGFQTPEQTFRTFQTGLRADCPDLEYRCLSGDFKEREGVSQLGYREFREQLFRQARWLKFAARARIVEVVELAPDRRRIVARVSVLFYERSFAIDFLREDYFELWSAGQRRSDDELPWEEIAADRDGFLVVSVPLPRELSLQELAELRAGREWKIDGFPLSDELDP